LRAIARCARQGTLALIISGTGDVIEPDDGIVAVGSGAQAMPLAAARILPNIRIWAQKKSCRNLSMRFKIFRHLYRTKISLSERTVRHRGKKTNFSPGKRTHTRVRIVMKLDRYIIGADSARKEKQSP